MAEGFGAGEVAHHLGHGHGDRHARLVEILEAIVLAVVAVATAWSGYQAAKWDGRQAHLYGLSSRYRFEGSEASTRGGQLEIYDSTTFSFWLQATTAGSTATAEAFEKRFRPEFRRAFDAWLETDPFHNPKAPPGPIVMPQYHNAELEAASASNTKASAAFEEGTTAREQGDRYVRNTVLLATVLFLVALAQRFTVRGVRVSLIGVSAVLLVLALYFVATYPTA